MYVHLRAVDGDCKTLLRYLRAKKQQLQQLQQLGARSPVLGLNAFNDIVSTFTALDEKTDVLTGKINNIIIIIIIINNNTNHNYYYKLLLE